MIKNLLIKTLSLAQKPAGASPAAPTPGPAAPELIPPSAATNGPATEIPAVADSPRLESKRVEADRGTLQPDAAGKTSSGAQNADLLASKGMWILTVQPACAEMFGWKPKELVAQKLDVLFKPECNDELARSLQSLGASSFANLICLIRVTARSKTGAEFQTEVTLQQQIFGSGFHWAVSFRPLTGEPVHQMPQKAGSAQPTAQTANEPSGTDDTTKTILFIEDDPLVLMVYRGRLEREGFRIECAEDGLIALELLPKIRPDLVVLDLMLPKLHGLEVLKFIRADVNLKGTPVIVLSNAYMEGFASKAMGTGANRGMLKTQCTPTKLIAIIRELLRAATAGDLPPGDRSEPEPQGADTVSAHSEESALAKARAELLADGPQEIVKMRQDCLNYIKAVGTKESLNCLNDLHRRVRFFGGRAWLSGHSSIGDLTSAFEAALFDIVFKGSDPTPSVLQTIAQAVGCLGRILIPGNPNFAPRNRKSKVLVVDDDAVFNYTTTVALNRANLDVVCVQDPAASLQMIQADRFDIVLLDINMPGMDGFTVCEALRRIPAYKSIPVIFVTKHSEFQNRARSIIAGGNDLFVKPVSPLELGLKVTMRLLDPGVQPQKTNSDGATGAPAPTTSELRTNLPGESARAVEVPPKDREARMPTSRCVAASDPVPTAKPGVSDQKPTVAQSLATELGRHGDSSLPTYALPVENRPAENGRRQGGGPPTQFPGLEKQLSQSAAESKQQAEDSRKQLAVTTTANKQAEGGPAGNADALRSTGEGTGGLAAGARRTRWPVCPGTAGSAGIEQAHRGTGEAVEPERGGVETAGRRLTHTAGHDNRGEQTSRGGPAGNADPLRSNGAGTGEFVASA